MPKTEPTNADATYAFNVTFTRPDENDANVYCVGTNAYGHGIDSVEAAEAQVRRGSEHLTIISVKHYATISADGEVLYAEAVPLVDLVAIAMKVIAAAEGAGLVVDNSNVVDLVADNVPVPLAEIRAALAASPLASRFTQAINR